MVAAADGRIMVFSLSGPMSCSFAKVMSRRHAALKGYEVMILDLSEVPMIDFTTAGAIEDILTDTHIARWRPPECARDAG